MKRKKKFVFLMLVFSLFLFSSCIPRKGTCADVTSYDYNWGNDMKCTKLDGSTFYTNYEGAKNFEKDGIVVPKKKCINVTSYDGDWNNDMKCTKSDGSTFYTSYEGAEKFKRGNQ